MLRIWDRPSLKRQNASLIKCRSYYFHLNFYYILVIRIKKLIVEEGKVKQKQKGFSKRYLYCYHKMFYSVLGQRIES